MADDFDFGESKNAKVNLGYTCQEKLFPTRKNYNLIMNL